MGPGENVIALFTYAGYYPMGGWGDFEGLYDSVEVARRRAAELYRKDSCEHEYWEIVDLARTKIVDSGSCPRCPDCDLPPWECEEVRAVVSSKHCNYKARHDECVCVYCVTGETDPNTSATEGPESAQEPR